MSKVEIILNAVSNALGHVPFEMKSYIAKYNVQNNLEGRSFWATDDILKYFKSRIASCNVKFDGLLLLVAYSQSVDWQHSSREWRFIAFDVTGTEVERDSAGDGHRSRAKASQAAEAWVCGFDVVAHYRRVFESAINSAEAQKGAASAALANL